jgi:hypothetical protein
VLSLYTFFEDFKSWKAIPIVLNGSSALLKTPSGILWNTCLLCDGSVKAYQNVLVAILNYQKLEERRRRRETIYSGRIPFLYAFQQAGNPVCFVLDLQDDSCKLKPFTQICRTKPSIREITSCVYHAPWHIAPLKIEEECLIDISWVHLLVNACS